MIVPALESKLTFCKHVNLTLVNDEVIVVDNRRETMSGVQGPGAIALIRWFEGRTFGDALDEIVSEYAVEANDMKEELTKLVNEARERGWLEA